MSLPATPPVLSGEGRWTYRRSLASRVILLTTMAVGLAVAFVAAGAYVTVRMQLQASLDDSLRERAHVAAKYDALARSDVPPSLLGAADVRMAYVLDTGVGQMLDNDRAGASARRARAGRGQGQVARQRPDAAGRHRGLPGRRRADRGEERRGSGHRPVVGAAAERAGSPGHRDDRLRRGRRDPGRHRRLAGGPQRPAPGAPADHRSGGQGPHRGPATAPGRG